MRIQSFLTITIVWLVMYQYQVVKKIRRHMKEKKDSYINMELGSPRKDDDGWMHAIVSRRKLYDEFKGVVNMNNNPMFDTRAYKVEFADGKT